MELSANGARAKRMTHGGIPAHRVSASVAELLHCLCWTAGLLPLWTAVFGGNGIVAHLSHCQWHPQRQLCVLLVTVSGLLKTGTARQRTYYPKPESDQNLGSPKVFPLQSPPLDLIDTGKGLKVQTATPHLVSLGSGRLSVAITVLPLKEGITRIGRDDSPVPQDITIEGPGIEAEHCLIENRGGVITLDPCGHLCSLDGVPVIKPTQLTQDGHSETRAHLLLYSAVLVIL
ncbi:hypothetical protein NFI96_033239 [Prochilodus magdalenae]|nr:hypothetical protein NFI96_033239 [Prochilodus magdalenae]